MDLYIIIIACLVVVVNAAASIVKKRRRNFPPGPIGLPVVGYLPLFFKTKEQPKYICKLGKKYGDPFSLKIGSKDVVILNSTETIRQAFSNPNLSGRPVEMGDAFVIHSPLLTDSGWAWQEHRRFFLRTMRDLGLGKSRMTELAQTEIGRFLEVLSETESEPFDPSTEIAESLSHIISILLMGKPMTSNRKLLELFDNIAEAQSDSLAGALIFFPWIAKIPYLRNVVKNKALSKAAYGLKYALNEEIENHKRNLNPLDVGDLIDAYLVEVSEKAKENKETTLAESKLFSVIIAVIGASRHTMQQTLRWCFYIMAVYPNVQEKIHKELDSVVGKDRMPDSSDESQMPITMSVIMEVLRWRTSAALNIPRATLADTKIGGYDIPKGTIIFANLWAALYSDSWLNPDVFNNWRFLNNDGSSTVKNQNFLPFSFGARSCPGDTYAMAVMFLYVARFFQRFTVRLPPECVPDLRPIENYGQIAKPYKLMFIPRN